MECQYRFAKFGDGTWGVLGPRVEPGTVVTVTRKNGSTADMRVLEVMRTALGDSAYMRVENLNGKVPRVSATGEHKDAPAEYSACACAECGAEAARLVPCKDINGIDGMCCTSCARLSRYERSFA